MPTREILSKRQIQNGVTGAAMWVSQQADGLDWGTQSLIVVPVLHGGLRFGNCVFEGANVFLPHLEYGTIRAKSYHEGDDRREPVFNFDDLGDVRGARILLFDDIVDTGWTAFHATHKLLDMGAREVKTASLLDKPGRREVNPTDFQLGFAAYEVPEDAFVYGFGMDLDATTAGQAVRRNCTVRYRCRPGDPRLKAARVFHKYLAV